MKVTMNEEIDYSRLCAIVKNENIDYIALALTPWHALSVVGAINKVIDFEKKDLKGIVLIMKNHCEEYLIGEDYFKDLNAKVYFYSGKRTKFQYLTNEIKTVIYCVNRCKKQSGGNNFYVFSHNHPQIMLMSLVDMLCTNRNIISTICDEGVGSYTDTARDRLLQYKSSGSSNLKIIKNWIEENFLYPKACKALIDSKRYWDLCMLKGEKELTSNDDMPIYIKKAIESYVNNNQLNVPQIDSEYVLINTQYYTKSEILSTESLYNFWKSIIEFYINHGYEVWIKPHPRESNIKIYNTMGANIIDENKAAQEVLLTKMKPPKYLLSMYSTTLVTAPLLNDLKSVCLAKIAESNVEVTDVYINYSKCFCEKFSKITQVLNSIEELPL